MRYQNRSQRYYCNHRRQQAATALHVHYSVHTATIWPSLHVQGPVQEVCLLNYVDEFADLIPEHY